MYLDPGFGSMLIQAVLAVIACGGVMLVSMRSRIRLFLKKKQKTHDSESTQPIEKEKNFYAADSND